MPSTVMRQIIKLIKKYELQIFPFHKESQDHPFTQLYLDQLRMDGADMMKTRYKDRRVKSRIVWACSEFPGISGSSHGRTDTFIL